jgi:hypothetical protein
LKYTKPAVETKPAFHYYGGAGWQSACLKCHSGPATLNSWWSKTYLVQCVHMPTHEGIVVRVMVRGDERAAPVHAAAHVGDVLLCRVEIRALLRYRLGLCVCPVPDSDRLEMPSLSTWGVSTSAGESQPRGARFSYLAQRRDIVEPVHRVTKRRQLRLVDVRALQDVPLVHLTA